MASGFPGEGDACKKAPSLVVEWAGRVQGRRGAGGGGGDGEGCRGLQSAGVWLENHRDMTI